MRRFLLALANEFKLARTQVAIHMVIIVQPTIMFLLMATILVHPTFDLYVVRPETELDKALVAAMEQVGSPIGLPYINPILVSEDQVEGLLDSGTRQVVVFETRDGTPTAVQRYGLIDSNIVKNFRNRLTAAAIRVWNQALGSRAITLEEFPWMPRDVPYTVYFGMAMLPLTTALTASIMGGVLSAQEFEYDTILEYRLAPAPLRVVLGARLTRLVLSGLISAGLMVLVMGLKLGVWPTDPWKVLLILLPLGVIAGSLGIIVGLAAQMLIPAFLFGLVSSFFGWLLGGAFGLAAGFDRVYELISRLTPHAHAVELLFPCYYGVDIANEPLSITVLILMSAASLVLVTAVYRRKVQGCV
jgi:hypothetical protein